MDTEKIKSGRCSFIVPDGYEFDEEFSQPSSDVPECEHCNEDGKTPVCITLTCLPIDEIESAKDPEEVNLDAFSPTISLLTLPAKFNKNPMDYMRQADEALHESIENYEVDFCEKDKISGNKAARSQSFFITNFAIYRLGLAWLVDEELVVLSMMTTENGVEKGWNVLKSFAESMELISNNAS